MNSEGFGSNGAPFEYTVEKKGKRMKRRKILLILAYVGWVAVFFALGLALKIIGPLLCFIPLSVWIISFFTWRFSKEEVRITFFRGEMTLTRMYDGKNPKKLAEVKIKDIESLEGFTPKRSEQKKFKNLIIASQNDDYSGAYLISWGDTVAVMDINEKAMKIIKYYNNKV